MVKVSQAYRRRQGPQPRSMALAALSFLASIEAVTCATSSTNTFPSIDFGLLGAVGVAGSFAGVQVFNQSGSTSSADSKYDPTASTLIARAANGTLTKIASTEEGGRISAVCQFDGSPEVVFVGGSFSSMGGKAVSNIASYNPTTKEWSEMGGGLDGNVRTLFCDNQSRQVLAGGSFSRPTDASDDRYLGAVATWKENDRAWSPLDFGGLDGTVNVIEAGSNSSLVRFGGDFDLQFATMGSNGTQSGTNTSASALTSVLAPISLGQSEFTGGPSSADGGFNDPAQILCPQGADGSGNSYLFADGATGRLTARTFRALDVRAIRLGNTFQDGRGTRTFGIVSIPDNTELQLIYLDPTTNQNVTCTNNCTLSHDPSIPYQDFLIADTPNNNAPGGIKTLTGVQFTASEYYGAGAGLHILELLSVGGWAYAYNGYNRGACDSSEPGVNGTTSTATSSGGWYQSSITRLAGTTEPVLALTDSYSNLASNLDATVTWQVDIPVNGNYSVYIYVPGCSSSGQCGERTDVNVNVFNNASTPGALTRVSQTNRDDRSVLVYDGEVQKAADGFQPTIILSIPSDAPAPSGGDSFTVIADKVSFTLRNSNETLQMSRQSGFGVLEYNVFDEAAVAFETNGTGTLPNSTMTSLGRFSTTLFSQGVRKGEDRYVTAVASAGGRTFVGGSFSSSGTNAFSNIISFTDESDGNAATLLANGGLNDIVTSLATVGDHLFVGGNFTRVADGSLNLQYIARYDPSRDTWAPLGEGPDGPVTALRRLGDKYLLVTGEFNSVNGTGQAGGYAIWDSTANAWQQQPVLLAGNMTTSSAIASTDTKASYLAGSVKAISNHAAAGAVGLSAPARDGQPPQVNVLNFQFTANKSSETSSTTSSNTVSRRLNNVQPALRGLGRRNPAPSSFGSKLVGAARALLPRSAVYHTDTATHSLLKRADAMNPASLASTGTNEIYASAFWQRSDGSYVNIIGGNFTTTSGIKNIGMYDTKTNQLVSFPGLPAPDAQNPERLSVVRSLLVDNDILYAGGDGGFESYDLKRGRWNDNAAGLSSTTGARLSVTSIDHRPESSSIIVAGSFDQAGSLLCMNICEWDTNSLNWNQLGAGVDGQISSLDFAGSKAQQLVVAGSITLNNQETCLVSYDFDTQIWTALGSVGTGNGQAPGPATAASVDDLNINSIFVAGRTSDGTEPYLTKWDGTSYVPVGGGELLSDSGVAQLTFVPISRAHGTNSILENNRLLVVSGSLVMQDYGNISSALFDGQNWTPFLVATDINGNPGVVRTFARSTEVLKFPNLHRLAVGLVILISIAIGLGIVFLLVLIGLLWALSRRNPNQSVDVPISSSEDSFAGAEKTRPSSLLATLNAATENVMGGGAGTVGAGAAGVGAGTASAVGAAVAANRYHDRQDSAQMMGTIENSDETGGPSHYHSETGRSGASQYQTGDEGGYASDTGYQSGGAAAAAYAYADHEGEAEDLQDDSPASEGIPAHARYDFEPKHDSELGVRAGEQIEILDDQDEHWWLARNAAGQTGVIPSTYVL
ncbi:hypothetical protein IE53DRAFT_68983 [Violaceomyces palustris]|uniref:Uncharacterized protein n=1 Tax=Violaceomyces palustris TaxID=1673888 RepID=A0ACD0NYV3_9BASI|nr:hypothetical protein IE53DRAFT_68983 [Violaceomyces palustris]